jgi:hypothetical protein
MLQGQCLKMQRWTMQVCLSTEEKEKNMRKRAMQRQRFPNTNMQPGISQMRKGKHVTAPYHVRWDSQDTFNVL